LLITSLGTVASFDAEAAGAALLAGFDAASSTFTAWARQEISCRAAEAFA
jgi:hypothetical protein